MSQDTLAASQQAENSYDQVPYPSYPFPQSHPNRLATVATLFGMTPAPVDNCRVLELGCASGGNLIPMAELLPESQFVGIDDSTRQIEMAGQLVNELGLPNVDFNCLDILDVDDAIGQFDYIICTACFLGFRMTSKNASSPSARTA